jgi:hypothetical protein
MVGSIHLPVAGHSQALGPETVAEPAIMGEAGVPQLYEAFETPFWEFSPFSTMPGSYADMIRGTDAVRQIVAG